MLEMRVVTIESQFLKAEQQGQIQRMLEAEVHKALAVMEVTTLTEGLPVLREVHQTEEHRGNSHRINQVVAQPGQAMTEVQIKEVQNR
jgi:hypothetical protein